MAECTLGSDLISAVPTLLIIGTQDMWHLTGKNLTTHSQLES